MLVNCFQCNQVFNKHPKDIKRAIRQFCKKACFHSWSKSNANPISRGGKVKRNCAQCGAEFTVRAAIIQKGKQNGKFCGWVCAGAWRSGANHGMYASLPKVACGTCGKEIQLEKRAKVGKTIFCSRACHGKDHAKKMSGPNSPTYVHGRWADRYSENFCKKIAPAVRKRDKGCCRVCGLDRAKHRRALDVHHIDYSKKNNSFDNLITLCTFCHGAAHGTLERRVRVKVFMLSILGGSLEAGEKLKSELRMI